MKYKCVIFDCDGVLVDTEEISIHTMVFMANELGIKIDFEYAIENFLGKSFEYCFEQLSNLLGKPLPETFENDYRDLSFERFQKELQPVVGVRKVIESLNVPFCVASNGPLEKVQFNLKIVGFDALFTERMFSAYQVHKFKPDPALFIYAAATLGFKPEECVVIEDSDVGVRAAIDGGFDVFGFANSRTEKRLKKEGAKLFYHMDALQDLLEKE